MGIIRCLLAICVVIVHSRPLFDFVGPGERADFFLNGDQAVTCFFIISGFLIALILDKKYTDIGHFYRTRFLRIYAPYYVALIFTLIIFGLGFELRYSTENYLRDVFGTPNFRGILFFLISNFFIFGTELAVFFAGIGEGFTNFNFVQTNSGAPGNYSYLHGLLIPQAWTLSFELQFYLLAPIFARLRTASLALVTIAIFMFQENVYHLLYDAELRLNLNGSIVFHFHYFLFGMIGYRSFVEFRDANLDRTAKTLIAYCFVFLSFALVFKGYYFVRQLGMRWYMFYILFACTVPFLFYVFKDIAWDRWIGELSYPIYLFHIAVIAMGANSGLNTIIYTVLAAVLYVITLHPVLERYRRRIAADKRSR